MTKLTRALILALTLLATSVSAHSQNTNPTGNPGFQHPLIKKHGGIVVLPDAAQQPEKNSKVVLDITSDEMSGDVIKGFDRAALILNQYTQAEAGMKNGFKMALILHGPATKAALSNDAYARHSKPYSQAQGKNKNTNLELLEELKKQGVEIYVCAQALAHHGYATGEVASAVTIAVSAATVNINKQMDGYAFIPFF